MVLAKATIVRGNPGNVHAHDWSTPQCGGDSSIDHARNKAKFRNNLVPKPIDIRKQNPSLSPVMNKEKAEPHIAYPEGSRRKS